MSDLAELRFKRGICKASLTRLKNYAGKIDYDAIDEKEIIQLKLRLEAINKTYIQFEEIQNNLEYFMHEDEKTTVEDLNIEENERTKFEENYFEIVAIVQEIINNYEQEFYRFEEKVVKRSESEKNVSSSCVKLPALKLPNFSGLYEKWLEFRDLYLSLVHDNKQLDEIQKFYYLKSCLSGEAAQKIESIPITSANYSVAFSILKEAYENKRIIVETYINNLFKIQGMTKENGTDLKNLYDSFTKNLRSLKNLGQPVETWDTLLIHVIVSKFDNRTRRDWEGYKIKGELPTMEEVSEFLKEKYLLLDKLGINTERKYENSKGSKDKRVNAFTVQDTTQKFACYFCKNDHSIFKCDKFLNLSIDDRIKGVKELKLCVNCLNPNHSTNDCTKTNCRKCKGRHNTILHHEKVKSMHAQLHSESEHDTSMENVCDNLAEVNINNNGVALESVSTTSNAATASSRVISLLSTALVNVKDRHKQLIKARMLLDPGSQSNFITEKLAKRLGLDKCAVEYSIAGIGNNFSTCAKYKMSVSINSLVTEYSENISCLILPKITQYLPNYDFSTTMLNIPEDKVLADPSFNKSQEIDILCGVGIFYKLLLMEQVNLTSGIILQNSKLGWILGGELRHFGFKNCNRVFSNLAIDKIESNKLLSESLERFWQVEDCTSPEIKDEFCENHFISNLSRAQDNKFIVKIPFKNDSVKLGRSKEMALKRFYYLERKLSKDVKLRQQYVDFINEYKRLGHLRELELDVNELEDDGTVYYVPHHPVLKESDTTPCRVVFDFSAKTDNNVSLNDLQVAGPSIQCDLIDILLRFRLPYHVLTADISKMYRQVWLHPSQTKFQRIFWRNSENEKLRCYELLTVTYGSKSSSFLATRALQQIAHENVDTYPEASKAIRENFYVDDYLDGRNDQSDVIKLQSTITQLLMESGFQLRKWLTNSPNLIEHFNIDKEVKSIILNLSENQNSKALGVYWNSSSDTIEYNTNLGGLKENENTTKRSILSAISQLFDPMGLVSPVVMKAKFILQLVWKDKGDWDDPVSDNLRKNWVEFMVSLQELRNIRIPRHTLLRDAQYLEIHLFVDASEKGYGACLYVKCQTSSELKCSLICSKSKVAPIKKLTLPRLELCAALLGSKLLTKVKGAMKINFQKTFCWTDSLVTYHWIRGSPDKWKTFVANRVSKIQSATDIEDWHHVRSKENPADLISRGATASDLTKTIFWFQGPHWLRGNGDEYPLGGNTDILTEMPETKTISNVALDKSDSIFERFSNLKKITRIMAYSLRFINNARNRSDKRFGYLDVLEIEEAFNVLIKLSQASTFRLEIADLKGQKCIKGSSSILGLNPFLDANNILRVGGRILNAEFNYDKKHPIILPKNHLLTIYIMRDEHKKLLHCGPQQLLFAIREKFWPLGGRNIARKIVHQCMVCFKAKPKTCKYIMGNLPSERLSQAFPFSHVGCDYAGPFLLKDSKARKPGIVKAWICIFVCMSTKAVHIELVSELTTQAFFACLRRFAARRGKPKTIFSDNGSQFVGSNNELLSFFKENTEKITKHFTDEGIIWKFIPPRAPNFGGIWEACVKSTKHHLKRVIGLNQLRFEDFNTVLCQIESILNSRPLTPLSSSPDDLSPLTPAHFLIGRPLTSLPQGSYIEIPDGRLKLYQQRQKMVQLFWKRWSIEYVNGLQVRLKWKNNGPNLVKKGALVIIKEDNLPPLVWKMARIEALHAGADGVIRVVSVRCSDGGVFKRAITKICVLPID